MYSELKTVKIEATYFSALWNEDLYNPVIVIDLKSMNSQANAKLALSGRCG